MGETMEEVDLGDKISPIDNNTVSLSNDNTIEGSDVIIHEESNNNDNINDNNNNNNIVYEEPEKNKGNREEITIAEEILDKEYFEDKDIPEAMQYLLNPSLSYEEAQEELLEQSINENPMFDSKESLLSSSSITSILFWAKRLSLHAKRIKKTFFNSLRSVIEEKAIFTSHNPLQLVKNNILHLFLTFQLASINKFEEGLLLMDNKTSNLYHNFDPLNFTSIDNKPSSKFPFFEFCYEYAISLFRFAKSLHLRVLFPSFIIIF